MRFALAVLVRAVDVVRIVAVALALFALAAR